MTQFGTHVAEGCVTRGLAMLPNQLMGCWAFPNFWDPNIYPTWLPDPGLEREGRSRLALCWVSS